MNRFHRDTLFTEEGVDWEEMKRGFRDIENNYPGSRWILNDFCRFACRADDKETARELFARIDNQPYLRVRRTLREFQRWRAWAESE